MITYYPITFYRDRFSHLNSSSLPVTSIGFQRNLHIGISVAGKKKDKELCLISPETYIQEFISKAKLLHINLQQEVLLALVKELVIRNNPTTTDFIVRLFTYYGESTELINPLTFDKQVGGYVYYQEPINKQYTAKITNYHLPPLATDLTALIHSGVIDVLTNIEASYTGYDIGLLADTSGNLIDTPDLSIYMIKGGVLYTPPTYIKNLTKEIIIQVAQELFIDIKVESINWADALLAEEMFIVSGFDIISLKSLEHKLYTQSATADNIRQLFNNISTDSTLGELLTVVQD